MADEEIIKILVLVIGSYFLGAIPSAYLAGKLIKGIDLRKYGSGTVSGSMVYEHVAKWAVVPVGLFDIAKAAIPTWVGVKLGLGEIVALMAGMAAAIGHNWPIYLGFTGGRGLSNFAGIMLVLFPEGVLWIGGFLLVGWLLGDSAPWALVSLVTMPLFGWFFEKVEIATLIGVVILVVTIIKRIEANRRQLPKQEPERRKVLLRRLIFDRDIKSHQEWINRKPERL
ncbi:MAG TPA: glycerol-3-phosphate acyltransferase [Anaerolineae bacterium]|nr:glycerol-3-phosphate acyltransferase [Anaerolineae bacterium]